MKLGYHLTLLEQRVLLVDMDPQASLTVFMGLEPSELDKLTSCTSTNARLVVGTS
jgi:chromosome partitioning protein